MTFFKTINKAVWNRKATAFAVRSHRHLWGKNNEDPLAYLFTRGLKNQFIKDQYLGWNKFGQERPVKNWGMKPNAELPEKFLLPPGIVIPFIKDTLLISIFIQPFGDSTPTTNMVPGSRSPTLRLDSPTDNICVITDLIDGLFLFQEKKEDCSVIILTDAGTGIDPGHKSLMNQAGKIRVYQKKNENMPSFLKQCPRMPEIETVIYGDRLNSTDLAL